MADDIVQTIKIEVEGADQAATEINKVGQAAEDVQKTAARTAGGTQELGRGLDDVSQKSGVSSRQLRALGKVMKDLGGGEVAGTTFGLARMALILGPVGAALFALGAAFKFVTDKMKEAEEATKAVTATFAKITKASAEMKEDKEAAFWGMTPAALKEFKNDVDHVADQLKNIQAGRKDASLTSDEGGLEKGFIKLLEQRGIAVNDVMADEKKLGEASRQTALEAAKVYENLSPIQKLNFENVLKGLKFSEEQIKGIEKGSESLRKAQEQAKKPFFTPEQQKSVNELAKGWDVFAEASKRAWGMVAGDAETGTRGWVQTIGAALVAGFADAMAVVGKFERDAVQVISQFVTTSVPNAWQWIKDTAASVWEETKSLAQQAYDAVIAFVTAAPGNAWQWIADTAASVWETVKTRAAAAYDSVVEFVTKPVASAWQWVVDTWNAMVAKLFGKGGGSSSAPAAAPSGMAAGGLLGGRGSGTSDSNLAWVSRGEYITPARAVAQPGVLAFLEALRRSGGNLRNVLDGMGRFALGGMVHGPIGIPAFAGGGMSNVTIQFPGLPEITGLRASSGVVDELRKAAAMAQVRSGGRKPSRYS